MEWKAEMIRSCFNEEDADSILSIPLSLHWPKDRMIWAETPSGKFTVKSAYRLAYKENRDGGAADCLDPSARKKAWKGIWRMNLPQKVKHFSWKACRDILASKEALRQDASWWKVAVLYAVIRRKTSFTFFGSALTPGECGI